MAERFMTSDGLFWNHHPGWYFREANECDVSMSCGAERGSGQWTPYVEVNSLRFDFDPEDELEDALAVAIEFARDMTKAGERLVADGE